MWKLQLTLWHVGLSILLQSVVILFHRANNLGKYALNGFSQPKRCTLCVNTVAYTENFHGGASFSSTWWSFVFGVRCLWRHNLASYWCFQTNVLAKFIDKICIFFNTRSPYFMCHCTEYKLPALKVRISEENTFNATTQQFTTAKITGCALKQGSKFHSSLTLRQSNLQL